MPFGPAISLRYFVKAGRFFAHRVLIMRPSVAVAIST